MKKLQENPIAISSDSFFYEKDKSDSTLILGVGNYLMGDEGIGVQVIQHMAGLELPERTDILDGGTGGFLLLSCFEAYGRVIFIDATMDGKPPGTVTLRKPEFASDFPTALSVHDVGLKDMIEAVYLMDLKPELYLITISIREIYPMSIDLSYGVRHAIPKVTKMAFTLANTLAKKESLNS